MVTLGGLILNDERTRVDLGAHELHWRDHGFGLWCFRDRETGAFAGRGGLHRCHVALQDEVEAGWALMPGFWGRGIATEIARASVRLAFSELDLDDLVSFTLPDNLASRRVMEKTGFTYRRNFVHVGLPHVLYRLARNEVGPQLSLG